jgi:aryl-alcohol dehydrogenase-like predicted oxidoreductase
MDQTFTIGDETTVNRLGFGAMRLCGPDIIGPPADEPAAKRVLRRAVELGVDFIDTADSYGPGVSERLIGEELNLDAEDSNVIVATKAGLLRNAEAEWLRHGHPDYIRNQVLVSRDRLGVDTIDLYQYHAPDENVPFVDAVMAFAELKDDGFVRHIGLSNVTVEQLETAQEIVEIATVQNQYNIGNRADEAVLNACEDHGIGFMPWFPLGAGSIEADGVTEVAKSHSTTPHQVALAWLLHHSSVTLPIPGTSSVEHLEQNVAAVDLELTDAELAQLT